MAKACLTRLSGIFCPIERGQLKVMNFPVPLENQAALGESAELVC